MIKLVKWCYDLGYKQARKDVFAILERERDFHLSQAQIKDLQKMAEREDLYPRERPVTAKDHEQRRKAIEDVLTRLDPKKYPNIDNFMDLLK